MVTTKGTSTALALLILTGCSSGNHVKESPTTVTPSASSNTPSQSASPTEPPSPIPTASERPSADHESVATVESGNIAADVGQESGLVEDGERVFTINVESIDVVPVCPSRLEGEVSPLNGHFIVAEVTTTLAPEFDGEEFIALGADTYSLLDTSGTEVADVHTVASFECFSTDDLIAPVIYPGESESGKVVLDAFSEHGRLVYNPWGVPGSGWEWEF